MHVLEELSSMYELHQKIHSKIVLEDHLHLDDEGVVHLQHDESLNVYAAYRVLVQKHVFAHAFEGIISFVNRRID